MRSVHIYIYICKYRVIYKFNINISSFEHFNAQKKKKKRFINTEDYEGGFEMLDIEQLFKNIESNYDQWATGFAKAVIDGTDPSSVENFTKSLKRMGHETALPLAKTVFLTDHRPVLEKVTVPCTIIATTNDVVVPDSVPTYMQKTIAGETTVEVIDTEGHFPQLTAHHQFVQVLDRAFIN